MKTERQHFPGSQGHRLSAQLDVPEDALYVGAMVAHWARRYIGGKF